jgi:hypothetical protein
LWVLELQAMNVVVKIQIIANRSHDQKHGQTGQDDGKFRIGEDLFNKVLAIK